MLLQEVAGDSEGCGKCFLLFNVGLQNSHCHSADLWPRMLSQELRLHEIKHVTCLNVFFFHLFNNDFKPEHFVLV